MRKSKQERFPYFRLLFGIQCCRAIESSNLRMQQALWLMVHTNRSNIKIFIIYKTKKKTPTLLRFLQDEAGRVCNVNEKHQCNPCIAKWIAGRMKSQAEENVMKIFDIQPAGRQASRQTDGRTNENVQHMHFVWLAVRQITLEQMKNYKFLTRQAQTRWFHHFDICFAYTVHPLCVALAVFISSNIYVLLAFSPSLCPYLCELNGFFSLLHSCWLYFALNLQLKVCVRDQTNQHLQVQKTNRNVYVVNIRAK